MSFYKPGDKHLTSSGYLRAWRALATREYGDMTEADEQTLNVPVETVLTWTCFIEQAKRAAERVAS